MIMFRTLTPVLSILAALAIFFLFIRPQYADVQAVRQETDAYKQATQDYTSFQEKIDGLESKHENVSVIDRDRLDMFVPKQLDITQAFVDLESLVRQHSMLFGNVQVMEDTTAASVEEGLVEYDEMGNPITPSLEPEHADLGFAVIGTYAQFKEFLAALEQSLTLFEVTHIETEVQEGSFMQFDMTVRIYSLPSDASSTLPSVTAP
jgi:hypothetical protein